MSDCMMEQQSASLEHQRSAMLQQQQQQQQATDQQQQQMQMEQQQQQHMMEQCAVAQQQKMEQQAMEQHQGMAMALEQEHQQQQQQQQQGWNNEMSQAGYEQVAGEAGGYQAMSGTEGGQYGQYGGGEQGKEQAASLGVYTPDSSTNSVHSLHGYPESHDNMADQASYTQELTQPLDTSYNTVPDANTEPVHNTSVMESPSSIASVEMSQQYGEQSCSQNVHPRPVHAVNSSPGISKLIKKAAPWNKVLSENGRRQN